MISTFALYRFIDSPVCLSVVGQPSMLQCLSLSQACLVQSLPVQQTASIFAVDSRPRQFPASTKSNGVDTCWIQRLQWGLGPVGKLWGGKGPLTLRLYRAELYPLGGPFIDGRSVGGSRSIYDLLRQLPRNSHVKGDSIVQKTRDLISLNQHFYYRQQCT